MERKKRDEKRRTKIEEAKPIFNQFFVAFGYRSKFKNRTFINNASAKGITELVKQIVKTAKVIGIFLCNSSFKFFFRIIKIKFEMLNFLLLTILLSIQTFF